MTPEAINEAIAEWCGWRHEYDTTQLKAVWISPKSGYAYDLGDRLFPDYCNDLNAIHEAEVKLFSGGFYNRSWVTEMQKILDYPDEGMLDKRCAQNIAHATAPQRCEALLRTLNLWKDTP